MRRALQTIIIALAAGLLAVAAPVLASEVGLSADGEIYRVEAGTYGSLFPGAEKSRLDDAVLVLEIQRPAQAVERLLVPETEGPAVESTPYLLVEDVSNTVFLVWEAKHNYVHSQIHLASYSSQSGWSEVLELSGDIFSFKTSPQVAVTRDSYERLDADGNATRHSRTVFHTVWWEEAGAGDRAVYAPLILIDGVFQAPNQFFVLSDLDDGLPLAAPQPLGDLMRNPIVQQGRGDESTALAFGNPTTDRILGLDVSLLPYEISDLADRAGMAILDFGARQDAIDAMSERAGMAILDYGVRYRAEFIGYLAAVASAYVREHGETLPPDELAAGLRREILLAGARMMGGGHARLTSQVDPVLLELGAPFPGSAVVVLRIASNRPVPEVGAAPFAFLSSDAEQQIIGWQEGSTVRYVESRGDGWSSEHSLELNGAAELDLEGAMSLLRQRVRD